MEYTAYLEPVVPHRDAGQGTIGESLTDYSSQCSLSDFDMALIHVPEYRWEDHNGEGEFYADILSCLSGLYPSGFEPRILNMGILKLGNTIEDTEAAVCNILEDCMKHRVLPIIVGGSRRLTYSLYKAHELREQVVNITAVDTRLHLQPDDAAGCIGRIIKQQPNYLFNFSNLGYQTYLVNQQELKLAEELYFDTYRLGELRGDVMFTEPIIRSSEIFTISADVIKNSDFHSAMDAQPNGFYAEDVCQIMRYAGLSEKTRSVLISEINLQATSKADALLVAEMIWCFMEGYYSRKKEIPNGRGGSFLKYRVSLKDDEFQLTFYKSLKTDRWWMEVPVPPEYSSRYRKHHLIPCSYEDYRMATQGDLPDRWWKAYKKML